MNKTMMRIADAVREHRIMHTPLYSVEQWLPGDADPYPIPWRMEVRYRGSCVATVYEDRVKINACGYRTPTTRCVINAALLGANAHGIVFSRRRIWCVTWPDSHGQHVEFFDGMEVPRD